MREFMDRDFLLDTAVGAELYHSVAENMPIFDYHNHLSPKDIAEHRRFHDLTELWLETDHYKWRAMRANGVDEKYITGDSTAYEKFLAWAAVLPKLAGSPLYHWTHLELQRYFGITRLLNSRTAPGIWDETARMMEGDGFDTVSLLNKMKVTVLCTTDDPADSLEWHKKIREDDSISFKVLPSFRPDKYLTGDKAWDAKLCGKYGTDDIFTALSRALDFFCENGCRVSDHGFGAFTYMTDPVVAERMRYLGGEYARRGIVMQLHLGAVRNTSPKLFSALGPDAGGDSVGPMTDAAALAAFLGDLERKGSLPKTVLYNLNPADNTMMSTMAVNFAPNVRFGAAWWLNDHLRGITAQLEELAETGSLAASVGMLTDSRSFTSFVRHEYFRRILCRWLGRLVEDGLYPADMDTLKEIVADVCYRNTEGFIA